MIEEEIKNSLAEEKVRVDADALAVDSKALGKVKVTTPYKKEDVEFYSDDVSAFESITARMYEAIKTEVENDPKEMGYAGKSAAEIADLLNQSFTEKESPLDTYPPAPRISMIFVGIPFAPNAVDEALVERALK